jgi:hypothetical protein
MKYVKTFENFNYDPTNEGLMDFFRSVRDKWNNWKNQQAKKAADKLTEKLEKNPGIVQKAVDVFNKLSEKSQLYLKDWVAKWTPDGKVEDKEGAEEVQATIGTANEMRMTKYGSALYESYQMSLNESTESLAKRILKWLGLNFEYLALITILCLALAPLIATIAATAFIGFVIYGSLVVAGLTFLVARSVIGGKKMDAGASEG